MKNSILLCCLAGILSCCSNDNSLQNNLNVEQEELHDMSIYHLPSDWNTQDGKKISFMDLKGQPLVVVMIYTACKTACPRLVADMRQIEEKTNPNVSRQPRYVLVSIDPLNDSPEKLKQFAKANQMDGEQWLFLQGTEAGVRDFANILSMKYKRIDPMDFSHSNIISVFDDQGVLRFQKEGLGLQNDEIVKKIIEVSGP
ncbi:SCO family protein [Cyclobacterium sp.]|uniref:SCO family protein n=1 Tax=Cyclobacterium sp. TaxID=1966343 RepID=UPI0019CBA93F|nr:SCO family protein [Cyclobacterium sp.]MBD3627558.1 SCO family protein [Cyclobacterium sp.]